MIGKVYSISSKEYRFFCYYFKKRYEDKAIPRLTATAVNWRGRIL